MTLGCSDAEVLRSADGRHHAKRVRRAGIAELADERDRQLWLAEVGVAAPRVESWQQDDDGAALVSTTVPGIPASAVTGADAEPAMRSIGAMLAGRMDLDELDDERHGRSARSLLTELEQRASGRTEQVVLCHGDASLPNLFLDPTTWEPTGFVDVRWLGRADRYLDLAPVLRSMDDDRNPGYRGSARAAFWSGYGTPDAADADADADALYRLLEQFF